MTPLEHWKEADRLLDLADNGSGSAEVNKERRDSARVHAQLAAAGFTLITSSVLTGWTYEELNRKEDT